MRLSGSITALATPFTVAGEIDLDAWRRLLQAQLDGGTQALVVAGSTGEAAALYDVEYDAILRTAVEIVAGRVPVLAGTGLSNTAKTIEQTRRVAALGADAGLPARVGQGHAEGFLLPRPTGEVAQPANSGTLYQAHGAGVVIRPDRLRAVDLCRSTYGVRHQIERSIP